MEEHAMKTVDVSFHGVEYTITVSNDKDSAMYIEVEQKADSSCWKANFSAKQVEEITAKSGGLKKLPVFVKMLHAALRQQSDSVFADLLTYADLEALRARKAAAGGPAAANHILLQNKRYLILTYAGEFDRIHYPLPLAYDITPDPSRLKGIIKQLREQLRANQGRTDSTAQVRQLHEEISILRQQSRGASSSTQATQPSGALQDIQQESQAAIQELHLVREECEKLRQQCQAAEVDGERQRVLQRRELRRRAQEATAAQQEAAAARTLVLELQLRCRELEERCDKLKRRQLSPPRSRNSTRSMREPWAGISRQSSLSAAPRPGSRSAGASPRRASRTSYSQHNPADASRRRTTLSGHGSGYTSSHSPRHSIASRPERFDPTEYIRQRREKQLEAAKRQKRFGSPGRATSSLPPSRSLTPPRRPSISRDMRAELHRPAREYAQIPPAPSRSVFRDLSPSRPRNATHAQAASHRQAFGTDLRSSALAGSSGSSPRLHKPWQQENLEVLPRAQRAASPSQALRDVKARLNSYVGKRSASSRASSDSEMSSIAKGRGQSHPETSERDVVEELGGQVVALRGSNSRLRGSYDLALEAGNRSNKDGLGIGQGGIFGEASADIADIDSRLQSLQEFLRAAKAGSGVS